MGFILNPWAIAPIIVALTVHEFCHALVAFRLGDPTAARLGRLTLNPLRHLDPVGTLLLFFAGFGWAKPVPVEPRNLASPRRDMLWIAGAGPASNLVLALFSGLLWRLTQNNVDVAQGTLATILLFSVHINLILAVFNALPLAPLDGAAILKGLLPPAPAAVFSRYERYGGFVLLALVASGYFLGFSLLWFIIGPPVDALGRLFTLSWLT